MVPWRIWWFIEVSRARTRRWTLSSLRPIPRPLHPFLTQLDEMRSGNTLDIDRVGRLLVEPAADEEYLGPLIAEIPSESPAGTWLVKPERGPRLVLLHRPDGMTAYTHSHHCWVAVTACTSSSAKSMTPSGGRGGTLRPVIQAGPIAERLDSSRERATLQAHGRTSAALVWRSWGGSRSDRYGHSAPRRPPPYR